MATVQVGFVAANVVFLSRGNIIAMLISGFFISLIWTLNVKRVAFGAWRERFAYASGAMAGTYLGYLISTSV